MGQQQWRSLSGALTEGRMVTTVVSRSVDQRDLDHLSVSMVMLLRRPHHPSKEELQSAAERAWGFPFDGEAKPNCFVSQDGPKGLIFADESLISVLSASQPYLGLDPKEYAFKLPHIAQQSAWADHSAWMSLDCFGQDNDVLAYRSLAKLAAEMLTANCAGIYVPKESSFIPNSDSLYRELKTGLTR